MKTAKIQLFILFAILITTFFTFIPAVTFDFFNLDDHHYVYENPLIRELSLSNIKKIFGSTIIGNYQPLVPLSFAFDFQRYGLNPGGYHLTNILFHLLNVGLVFVFLRLIKQSTMIVIMVTFLFALHPLRVESVVWITERKDVLFLCMYLISVNLYAVSKRFAGRFNPYFILSLLFFLLSLLTKPAAVTLPIILLLIDWKEKRSINVRNIVSKISYVFPSILLSVFTIYGYHQPFDIGYFQSFSFSSLDRIFMGFYSLLMYGYKLIWPFPLFCFYPLPVKVNHLLPMIYYFSPFIVAGVCGLIYKIAINKNNIVFGGLFFLSTIITNLAFMNYGNVIIAERYTYLPSIGFYIILIQLILELWNSLKNFYIVKVPLIIIFIFTLFMMWAQTFKQVFVWKNSETIWSHVLHYFPNITEALFGRGNYYFSKKEYEKALIDYDKLISIDAMNYSAFNSRASTYFILGDFQKAFRDYDQAIHIYPGYISAYLNRSECFRVNHQYQESLRDIEFVLSKDPHNAVARMFKNKLIEKMKSTP